MLTRRELCLIPAALAAAPDWRARVAGYLASLARSDGAYAWGSEVDSHLTPTYFAIGCHRPLGMEPARKPELAEWVRTHHPLPERRQTDRPLHRFRLEQIQALLWLNADASSYLGEVETWTRPVEFTRTYEFGGNPVFQQETAGLRCRELLGLPVTAEWREYILARRRPDGTFNTTPAADGSGGHVMNTLWGLGALRMLGVAAEPSGPLQAWLRACQLNGGGFTYAPHAEIGGVDDIVYTWAALAALEMLGGKAAQPEACARYVASLWNADGGFGDRPGRASNPMATWYALAALKILGAEPAQARPLPAPRSLRAGLRVFTIQIEAPGQGSPADAVEMARTLGIHIWAAKNSPAGWVERAQQVADASKVLVRFVPGNEEYGNYVSIPGLGTYSHLADLVAPAGVDFGAPMVDAKNPVPWPVFREQRIGPLRRAGGRMIWQFNENEELTRALLDEAVETGTYAAISTFHFGIENFHHTQPFLMRYHDVLPFVALQDAHAREAWWWGDQLEGFRTVFVAAEPTWEQWLDALRDNRVMAICRDPRTRFETRVVGGDAALRRMVGAWWEANWRSLTRPAAMISLVGPGHAFEDGAGGDGWALRVRMRRQNSPQGMPLAAIAELVSLAVDDRVVEAPAVEKKGDNGRMSDVYHLAPLPGLAAGKHTAVARVRPVAGGEITEVRREFVV